VKLYTELFYAIIPTLFLCFFADVLSLHLVTFLMFFILVDCIIVMTTDLQSVITD